MSIELVSVIIPVYNVEQRLYKSLQTIVEQSIFQQLEVILIDDGSQDSSWQICNEFANLYRNIRLFHQENKGVSSARNKGIEESTCPYLAFFDADDLAVSDLYETLLRLIEGSHSDIAIVDFSTMYNGIEKKKHVAMKKVYTDPLEALKDFFSSSTIENVLVDKIYRKSTIENLLLDETRSIGEDMYFVFQAISLSKKIVLDTTESKYIYYFRGDSAMTSRFSRKNFDAVYLAEKILNDIPLEIKFYAEAHLIHEKMKCVAQMVRDNMESEFSKEKRQLLKDIRSYSFYRAFKYLSRQYFLSWCLIFISVKLYIAISEIVKYQHRNIRV